MGLSDTMCDCLGGHPETCAGFYDPIIDANLAVVDAIIEPICALIAIAADPSISVDLTAAMIDFALSISFDIPEIVAALGLPMLNGFDITGEIEIDVEFSLAALEFVIGLITIPVDIVLGWLADLPALPEIPTLDMILELVMALPGLTLPEANIACIAEMMMIPFDFVAGVLEAVGTVDVDGVTESGICPGDGSIDHGSLFA